VYISESVTGGHPDKLCDQISDAIVDHLLGQDPFARVRAECAVAGAIVFIAARFAAEADIDFTRLARKVIQKIGYDQADFNATTCSILTAPQALPVNPRDRFNEFDLSAKQIDKIAAQNQVTLFGFACDQTPQRMPLPIWLARLLTDRMTAIRERKILPYLMPDGKVQVGVAYRKGVPCRIHSVILIASQRRRDDPSLKRLSKDMREALIDPVFSELPIRPDDKTRILVNPDGPFLGGPTHHSGLTGRKNAIDTYGEYSRHSGKALSGKDPLRIDRVGAYAARYAALNLVAAGLAKECEVVLSYSIGVTKPVSLLVNSFGTGSVPDEELAERVAVTFDFRPAGILKKFNLRYLPSQQLGGFYRRLAAGGHVGRTDMELPWERTDMAEALAAG
jgi:S-adenosylmethionine synthetase